MTSTAATTRHLAEIKELAISLMRKNGLGYLGYRFRWDNARKRAGCCHYSEFTISLSKPLMSIWTVEQARLTILHEIAHALVGPGHGHDGAWRRKVVEIGGEAKRCWDQRSDQPESLPAKYIGVCPRGHEHRRDRRSKYMDHMSCGRCSSVYNPDYKITWRVTS